MSEQVGQLLHTRSGDLDALRHAALMFTVVPGSALLLKGRGLKKRWRTTSPRGKSSNISAPHSLASDVLSSFSVTVNVKVKD